MGKSSKRGQWNNKLTDYPDHERDDGVWHTDTSGPYQVLIRAALPSTMGRVNFCGLWRM